ncbi:TraB/GumN family protein [Aliikangiella sp. IMCC44359]|uniref:TraB/GumN family protein n=1 Tax=Aliikangiella sp. IMCC44359 TaxID=3459125 RepID=UPI00403B36D3
MKKLLALLLTGFIAQNTFAETSVWKATKDEATVYLGGTIHFLRQQDYPLPKEFEQAYQASQAVTFETDISQLRSPKMMQMMLKLLSYQDERTISSVVTQETYQKLEQHAKKRGVSLDFYRKAKPGMLMSVFLAYELQIMGATQEGIDAHFSKRAEKDKKSALFLETPEEQLNFLAQMGLNNEDAFYLNMLQDFTNTNEQFSQMIKLWRSGNAKGLDELANDLMKKDYPKMYQSLLVDRNNNWMPIIENYFKTKEVEFVLVGAAHLVGEQGIVKQLQKKGYQLEKL